MKVYLCWNGQKTGEHAVCATLDRAKQWLQDSIRRTAGEDGEGDQWDGWAWWTDARGRLCFGGDPAKQPPEWKTPVPEGTITELELVGSEHWIESCPECNGTGATRIDGSDYASSCRHCDGTGTIPPR